jgi:hypothetical protein
MITKSIVSQNTEQVFEKEVILPIRKERFTIRQKEVEKARLQAQIDLIDADIAEAKGIV